MQITPGYDDRDDRFIPCFLLAVSYTTEGNLSRSIPQGRERVRNRQMPRQHGHHARVTITTTRTIQRDCYLAPLMLHHWQ